MTATIRDVPKVELLRQRTQSKLAVTAFAAVHLACFGALFTGVSAVDVAVALGLYWIRMFAITAGYHRYFAHRTYKMGRAAQFVMAFTAVSSAQKGALWWAANHRHHHRYSDRPEDLHSPRLQGFWWSHMGWILSDRYEATRTDLIKDFAKFPELVWLDRWHLVPPTMLALAVLAVFGWSGLFTGFFLSTVVLWHATFTINSLCHVWGSKTYETDDDSRNNFWLSLLTLGEGWHNNHHYYQASVNQGFRWWQIDISYYALRVLAWMGVVWDLREAPAHVIEKRPLPGSRADRAATAAGVAVVSAPAAEPTLGEVIAASSTSRLPAAG